MVEPSDRECRMTRRPKGNALLVEVLADFGSGRIAEKFIRDGQWFVHGETCGRDITINPAIGVVDTLLHECLHRIRPNWCENYIRRTTTWLMRRMSDEQIQQIFEEYNKRVKRRKPA
jgi:hypothetical protein